MLNEYFSAINVNELGKASYGGTIGPMLVLGHCIKVCSQHW